MELLFVQSGHWNYYLSSQNTGIIICPVRTLELLFVQSGHWNYYLSNQGRSILEEIIH